MSKTLIERIKAEDWQKYRELKLKALLEEPTAFSTIFEEERNLEDDDWIDKVSKFALSERQRVVVAKRDENIIGMMGVIFDSSVKRKHIARIVSVFVPRAFRGKGLSRKLMEALLANIQEVDYIRKVKLTVNANQEPAINLYKSFGFREVGKMERDMKVEDGYADIIMMEMWLEGQAKSETSKAEKDFEKAKSDINKRKKSWLRSLTEKLLPRD